MMNQNFYGKNLMIMLSGETIDKIKVFPGYHMNKKSWITIKLDNSMETNTIFKLIDNSYNLATTKK